MDDPRFPLPCQGALSSSTYFVYIFSQRNATVVAARPHVSSTPTDFSMATPQADLRRDLVERYHDHSSSHWHSRDLNFAKPPERQLARRHTGRALAGAPDPWFVHASSVLDNRAFEFVLGRSLPGRSGVPLAGARLPVADSLQAIVRYAVVKWREKRRGLAPSHHICRKGALAAVRMMNSGREVDRGA